jgi:hypothetical protein
MLHGAVFRHGSARDEGERRDHTGNPADEAESEAGDARSTRPAEDANDVALEGIGALMNRIGDADERPLESGLDAIDQAMRLGDADMHPTNRRRQLGVSRRENAILETLEAVIERGYRVANFVGHLRHCGAPKTDWALIGAPGKVAM